MPLTVNVNTTTECLRTDCNISGDKKNVYHGIRQPEGGSRARILDRYFFLRRRSDGRIKKTA